MENYHLAQINIAKAKQELDSPVMKGFVDRLDEINALADASPGFVWRLQTEDGDATNLRVFDDPQLIINMSVWQNVEALQNFVYNTVHVELLQRRKDWFNKTSDAQQAMWWMPKSELPTVEQGKRKLTLIQERGPTKEAFNFSQPFSPTMRRRS